MSKPNIEEIKGTRITWLHVSKTSSAELNALKKRFGFLDIDLKECPPPLQRPKILGREKYLFMILLFPIFDRLTRKIVPVEVDFFVGKNYLVTVCERDLESLIGNFTKAKTDKSHKLLFLNENTGKLLYFILDGLLNSCFPMLVHVSNDIDTIEDKMHEVHDRNTIHEIFRLKTNVVNFKKSMQPHKMIIRKLIELAPKFFPAHRLSDYLENLVEHTKEIWDTLELNSDTLNAIEDSHLSLLSFRTNDIIRTLTIFSVIVFPLTLVASIFGMNTSTAPIIGHALDFWIIISLMTAGALGMLAYFKARRWL